MSKMKTCRTCVHTQWNYPSTECGKCRGYSHHAYVLPNPAVDDGLYGICPGEPVHNLDDLEVRVDEVIKVMAELAYIKVNSPAPASTRASALLSVIADTARLKL